jgi:Flp pilus assembly protein TadD
MPDSTALRDALNQSPNNLSLLLLHGRACMEEMKLDEARAAFTSSALELDPDLTDAHLGIARVLFIEGDTSGAAVRCRARPLPGAGQSPRPTCSSPASYLSRGRSCEGRRAL